MVTKVDQSSDMVGHGKASTDDPMWRKGRICMSFYIVWCYQCKCRVSTPKNHIGHTIGVVDYFELQLSKTTGGVK